MSHVLIIEARFYDDILDKLYEGVVKALDDAGVTHDKITVPGALEIPGAVVQADKSGRYDAYIALGCVIRGETYHFEVVCNESARGLMDLTTHHGLIISNGILTCETREQAVTRADIKQKDKGGSFAKAALDMIEIQNKYTKQS